MTTNFIEDEDSVHQRNEGQIIDCIDNSEMAIQLHTPTTIITEQMGQSSDIMRVRKRKRKAVDIEIDILKENATMDEINLKSVFFDKEHLKKCMTNIAISNNIQFKVVKSCPTRYWLKCLDDTCTWRFHASSIKDSLLFQVTKYEKKHTCSIDFITSENRNATSKVICDYILELVRDLKNVITPRLVVEEMRRYGMEISYHKGWRAIQQAYAVIRGTPEENYMMLPFYLHMMKEKNPGTYTNTERDNENRFKYAFFAYGASITGWMNCRPVIMVDATFLKSKYRGVLMIAISKDGNNNIFPLAFGIANSENNESYNWFFHQLKNAIGVREQLPILSDRHASIANAIANVYPECQHDICIYHMEKNLRQRYFSDIVLSLFYNAAISYKRAEFASFMHEIEKVDKVAAEYLKDEPPERWACSFHTNQRKMDAQGTFHDITRWAEQQVTDKIPASLKLKVDPIDATKFIVKGEEHVVDLKSRTCQCLIFQTDELPCIHAIAAINNRNLNKSSYCSHWFTRQT